VQVPSVSIVFFGGKDPSTILVSSCFTYIQQLSQTLFTLRLNPTYIQQLSQTLF
jgi:hypothetical protein